MAEFYTYTKKRKEFGKHPYLNESKAEVFGYFPTTKESGWQYEIMNPNFIDLDNIPEYSEHIVNTERVSTTDKGMYHKEGGWPSQIDPTEITETTRFKKKIEKEQSYTESVNKLTKKIEVAILQNNQIDMFEEYFANEQCEHQVEQISAKTLMLFKDQNSPVRRTVSDLSWYPESASTKIAVGYSILRFQQAPSNMPVQAYIWDMSKPNVPDITLNPTSAVSSISFNQKLSNIVGMGCANGLVQVQFSFLNYSLKIGDILKSGEPVLSSTADKSHSAPVSKLSWLSAKSGSELITTSTDGKVFWWDTRKLSTGPVDALNIVETYMDGDKRLERQIGGTSIEYLVDAGPNKFLVGTESGAVITASKRANKPIEIIARYGTEGEYHLGPVYQVHRSPPNYRFFLTVGDWGAKIWNEDLKSPIIRTKYHGAFLSDGCFSPVRPGLFFLIRKDGWLDIWDYYYRQNELAFSHKVSEVPLSCIKLNFIQNALGYQNGKYACIGDQDGTVTLMELCESLYTLQPNEKEIMAEMFDRETRKEKALEQKHKAEELRKQAQQKEKKIIKIDFEKKKQDSIKKAETAFYKIIEDDKQYYEEKLNLKLDQYASKGPQQQQEQEIQKQQQQEESQEIEQQQQQEPSIHKEEEQPQQKEEIQSPRQQQQEIQQESPVQQEQEQQPEEIQKEELEVQQEEEKQLEQPVVQEKQEEEQKLQEEQPKEQEQQDYQGGEQQQPPQQEEKLEEP